MFPSELVRRNGSHQVDGNEKKHPSFSLADSDEKIMGHVPSYGKAKVK